MPPSQGLMGLPEKTTLLSSKPPVPLNLRSFNRGFARQPFCMAGTIDSFSYGKKNVLSDAKHFHSYFHATWLPCKT